MVSGRPYCEAIPFPLLSLSYLLLLRNESNDLKQTIMNYLNSVCSLEYSAVIGTYAYIYIQ